MGLRQRISSWLEGEAEARKKRDAKRRRRARERRPRRRAEGARGEGNPPSSAKQPARRQEAGDGRRPSRRAHRSRAGRPEPPPRRRPQGRLRGRRGIGIEVAKLAREMMVIPVQLWLALAEIVAQAACSRPGALVLLLLLRAIGRIAAAACASASGT